MKAGNALAVLLLASVVGASNAAPQRIVSLNLCADELVLRLAPPGTVKSVTWLARDPTLSNVSALAQEVPATVAAVLGAPEKGTQLIADIRSGLSEVPISSTGSSHLIAAVYQPNGFTIGKGSLVNDLLNRAGLRNLAVERRIDNYGELPLEVLLFARPDLLIINEGEDRGPALAYEVLRHPALVHRYRGARVVSVPSAWWSCPGPRLVDAVQRLQHAAQRLPSLPRDER